ncbi:MAG TPA: pilus assembly protein PilC [Verrucomicrobia bacterium]|nr:pilus assembly protein PilC [Verrucomicrobiota bacterium]
MVLSRTEPPASDKPGKKRSIPVPGAGKIVDQNLPGFTRQVGAMLGAGMPIVACLRAMEEQTDQKAFKVVINQVRESLEGGMSLSESLRQFPSVFDTLYCNMVGGGETSGELSETMARLATFLETSAKLRRKVKSALMYPTVVLSMCIIISIGLITFVVPVFGDMFKDFDAALPAPTQFLLDLSGFMRKYALYLIAVIGGAVYALRRWKKTEQGAYAWDGMMLRLPVFGKLNRFNAAARFARMLSQMTRSGVPILTALKIVSGSTGNRVAGRIVENAATAVEKGDPLSAGLMNQQVYPIGLVRMLQAGEKTGSIDDMMDSIADYYEDEVETIVSGLTALMEPLIMAFLGIIIGGVVIAMFLPIFKMGEIVGG